MAKITLKVEFSRPTKNGSFFNKLVGESEGEQTAFGEVQGSKRTFYMFTTEKNKKNLEGEIDLSKFDIVEKDFDYVDEDTDETVTATLSYLYPKRA